MIRCMDSTPASGLDFSRPRAKSWVVWNQPYLETCCRAALHRLSLAGSAGRPIGMMDNLCLTRLADMGLCKRTATSFTLTPSGRERHATEILNVRSVAR